MNESTCDAVAESKATRELKRHDVLVAPQRSRLDRGAVQLHEELSPSRHIRAKFFVAIVGLQDEDGNVRIFVTELRLREAGRGPAAAMTNLQEAQGLARGAIETQGR